MDPDHKKEILDKLIKCEDVENPNLHFQHLRDLGNDLIHNPRFDDLIKFLNAIANKKRLMIINILREKEKRNLLRVRHFGITKKSDEINR